EEDKLYPLGSYLFDLKGHHLRREDKKTNLTPREAQILQLLYEDKGNVVKRKDILLQFWGTDDFFASRSLDVFINKLRKCLDDDKSVEIITIRGEGLKLAF
ncbi:MAG: winged helix-turn-helix domain-containing protein, partial [Tannerella sp.]|nr:winged helix-turn-helix domain-containing protein [Tannerella sp.]